MSSVESPTSEQKRQFFQNVLEGTTTTFGGLEARYNSGVMSFRTISPEGAERSDLAEARKVFGLEPQNVSLIVKDLSDPASRQERLVA